jgi:hypothetical protein
MPTIRALLVFKEITEGRFAHIEVSKGLLKLIKKLLLSVTSTTVFTIFTYLTELFSFKYNSTIRIGREGDTEFIETITILILHNIDSILRVSIDCL